MAFFVLPLVFALFAGRTFCAGVCPHGALQDLVLLKPVKVPAWLEQALSVLPLHLPGRGGAVRRHRQRLHHLPIRSVRARSSGMSGRTLMVLSGAALLLLGVFVGRPYCRFLCPYGALLKLGAIVAKWRVRVTPDYCTQCRLCEASCPFGAMREPESGPPGAASPRQGPPAPGLAARAAAGAHGRRRLAGRPVQRARPRGCIRPSAWPTSSCAREDTPPKTRRPVPGRPGARTRAADTRRKS